MNENEVKKRSEEMNIYIDNIVCSYNVKLNSDYELCRECLKCSNVYKCRYYIKIKRMKLVSDKIIKSDKVIMNSYDDLKIVNMFNSMLMKIDDDEKFNRKRMIMKLKSDSKESKRFSRLNSDYNKRRLIEKLKKMNVYEYDIKIVKKKKEVNKRSNNMNKYEKCGVVLSI